MRDSKAAHRRRFCRLAIFSLALLLLVVGTVTANDEDSGSDRPGSDHPGYFPLEELEILDPQKLSLEINLLSPMMRIVAAVTKSSDPAFSELLANLESVRVRVAPLDKVDGEKVRAGLKRAERWLQDQGWQIIVRSRDKDEQVHVYLRQDGGEIVGVAVLALDRDEATLLNIAGLVDLAQLVKLGEKFDISLLGELGIEDKPSQEKKP